MAKTVVFDQPEMLIIIIIIIIYLPNPEHNIGQLKDLNGNSIVH